MKTQSSSLRRGGASRAERPGVASRPLVSGRQACQPATRRRPAEPTVTVVMPALNEAESIGWVVENLPGWVDELVLVDGQSIDHTVSVVRRLEPTTVVVHQTDKGKGSALRAGFAAATSDIIVTIDADGSTDPREIPRFVEALRNGADFAKGSRHMVGGGSRDFTLIRRLGNIAFVALSNLLFGHKFTDLLYGYVAFWRSDLGALNLTATGFEIETELVLNAAEAGMRISEVPSVELPRRAGTSNLNACRDGLRVLRTMLKQRPGLLRSRTQPAELRPTPIDVKPIPIERPSTATHEWPAAGLGRPSELDARRKRTRAQPGFLDALAA
jgi:hypothetical protein